MSTTIRTYYDVLGVAVDTPDVVIKAAYRALAKEYHPDGTDKLTADTDKFIEIQSAYTVLSNPETRSEYDAGLREELSLPHAHPVAVAQAPEQGVLDLERIRARLAIYSDALASAFDEAWVRGECGEDPLAYAEALEREFFRGYFGEDGDIQVLARLLLLRSRKGTALTLNKLVSGGVSSESEDNRLLLQQILDQNFGNEALFAEWLKVKFGMITLEQKPVIDKAAAAVATPRKPPQTARAARGGLAGATASLRSFALLFFWAIALYFGLFAAFPLLQ